MGNDRPSRPIPGITPRSSEPRVAALDLDEDEELEISELSPLEPRPTDRAVPSWASGHELPDGSGDAVSLTRGASAAASRFAWIARTPGVLGHTCARSDGTLTESTGRGGAVLSEQCAYFIELARAVGDELGLDGLRELRISSREQRLLVRIMPDTSRVVVLAEKAADLAAVSTKLGAP